MHVCMVYSAIDSFLHILLIIIIWIKFIQLVIWENSCTSLIIHLHHHNVIYFSIHFFNSHKVFRYFFGFSFFFDPIEFDNNHHDGDSADDECIFFFLSFVVVVEMDPTKDKYPHTHTHTNLNFYDTFFSRSFIRYRFIFFLLMDCFLYEFQIKFYSRFLYSHKPKNFNSRIQFESD